MSPMSRTTQFAEQAAAVLGSEYAWRSGRHGSQPTVPMDGAECSDAAAVGRMHGRHTRDFA